jgi:hypothetical protein
MNWLPDMDLNHDKQIQSLLCYRYTIGQSRAPKVKFSHQESRLHTPGGGINGLMDFWINVCHPSELARRNLPSINPPIHQSINPLIH